MLETVSQDQSHIKHAFRISLKSVTLLTTSMFSAVPKPRQGRPVDPCVTGGFWVAPLSSPSAKTCHL